jgi:hypothetical protein
MQRGRVHANGVERRTGFIAGTQFCGLCKKSHDSETLVLIIVDPGVAVDRSGLARLV